MFNTPGDIFQSFGAALDTPASKKRKKPAPLPADGANRIWKGAQLFVTSFLVFDTTGRQKCVLDKGSFSFKVIFSAMNFLQKCMIAPCDYG